MAAASGLRARVLAGYRQLLRARAVAFPGDALALRESQLAIRGAFEQQRNVQDAAAIEKGLQDVQEAVDMLRCQIVQAQLNERGNLDVNIREDQATAMGEEEEITHVDQALLGQAEAVRVQDSEPVSKDAAAAAAAELAAELGQQQQPENKLS